MPQMLTPAQQGALDHVTRMAVAARDAARRRARDAVDLAAPAAIIGEHARVTLNFHPDRLLDDGTTVAEGLAYDLCYRGQFETGISNGSRTAFAGGERDGWERQLFGGAYHADGVTGAHRPR